MTSPTLIARIRRQKAALANRLRHSHPIDLVPRASRTAFLAACGRTGSTWVSELLSSTCRLRLLFEPFHKDRVPEVQHFRPRQYLRQTDHRKAYLRPVTRIVQGRISGEWVDMLNPCAVATRRMIKDIRANLLLGWLRQHFPEMPIALLMRHPCAYAHSRLKLEYDASRFLRDYLEQDDLMEDHLEPFRPGLEAALNGKGGAFAQHIWQWCVEYYVPLRQPGPGQLHIAFYEDLLQEPEATLRGLCGHFHLPFSSEVLNHLAKPSSMAADWSAIKTGGDNLNQWRRVIGVAEIKEAMGILETFGLHEIYGEESAPRARSFQRLGPEGATAPGSVAELNPQRQS